MTKVDPADFERTIETERLDKVKAENALLRAKNRALAKQAHAQDRIVEYAQMAIDALPTGPVIKPTPKPDKRKTVESAVLLGSCWHIGETISKTEMGGLNEYNFDVFCQRLQRLVDETIAFTQQNMSTHHFDELHFIHTGDFVSGTIHELEESNCLNIVEQATLGAFVTAQALRELARVFPRVIFTGVVGNHGRTKAKPYSKHKQQVNWDYIAYNYMAVLLADQPNIKFNIPLSFFAGVEIKGFNFHIAHGDTMRAWMGIPFYAMNREASAWLTMGAYEKKYFQYFIRSHFHTGGTTQTALGENIWNSSLKGGCEYALGIPAFNDPQQLLFGVHEKYGKTWGLPINTKYAKGPVRYKYNRDRSLAEQLELLQGEN